MALDDDEVVEEVAVSVTPSLTGFRRELKLGLARATAGIKVKIPIVPDTKGFRSALTDAVAKATRNNPIKLPITVDPKGLRNSINEAITRASRQQRFNLPVRVDSRGLRVELQAAMARAGRGLKFEIPVKTKWDDELAQVRLAREKLGLERDITREKNRQSRENSAALKGSARALGFGRPVIDMGAEGIKPMRLLIAAGVALSPILVAVGSSAGVAATSIAALGAAAVGAVGGVVSLTYGLSGILEVLKLKEQADKDALNTSAGLAATQMAQARAVENARDQIASAQRGVTDATREYQDSLRAVEDAERGVGRATRDVARAQRDVQTAQEEERIAQRELNAEREAALTNLKRQRAEALAALKEQREAIQGFSNDTKRAQLALDRARYELRRFEESKGTKMSDLSVEDQFRYRDAQIDVADAEERLGEVRRDQARKLREYNDAKRKGIVADDRVIEATRRVESAHERTVDAQDRLAESRLRVGEAERNVTDARRNAGRSYEAIAEAEAKVVDAQQDLTDLQAQHAVALEKTSSAANQLASEYAKLSKPAQRFVDLLAGAKPELEEFRRDLERGMVPGFLSFLKDITWRARNGASALSVMRETATDSAEGIGRLATRMGRLLRQPWFGKTLTTINKNNAASFDLLGQAAVTAFRPVLRIVAAASPLLVTFSKYLLTGAKALDRYIDRAEKSGDLARWFKMAGEELAKWWGIATNLGRFLLGILRASFPAGTNLVSRLRDFTELIADWANSKQGQDRMMRFFKFFSDLDYGQLFRTTGQLITLFSTFRLISFVGRHPLLSFLGFLATAHPGAAAAAITSLTKALGGLLKFVADNPNTVAGLIALFGAWGAASKLGIAPSLPKLLGDKIGAAIGAKLAARGGLLGKLGDAFGKKTAVMNVTAGTVNILGPGGVAPGGGGKGVPPVLGGSGGKGVLGKIGGALGWAGLIGGIAANPVAQGLVNAQGKLVAEMIMGKNPMEALQRYLSMELPNALTGGSRGWSSFKDAAINDFGSGFVRWFSHTLPDALNLGEGTGWSALGGNLSHWFGTTLPDMINLGEGSGWSALGKNMLEIGKDIIGGLWGGIVEGLDSMGQFFLGDWVWNKIKGFFSWALGIKSPSTKMIPFGVDLINGILVGVARRLVSAGPAFASAGLSIVRMLTDPFGLMGLMLSKHFVVALRIMDAVFINPVNKLLAKMKLPTIPNLASKTNYTAAGAIIGKGAADIANYINQPQKKAAGGPIQGSSPTRTADNIPFMGTAREWVMPVSSVDYYGKDMMAAIQHRMLPRQGSRKRWDYKRDGGQLQKKATGGPLGASGGAIWPQMWGWVRQRFPFATLNSAQAGRTDNFGFHPIGHAIDIGTSDVRSGGPLAFRVFNAIKRAFFPRIAEMIYDFAGSKAVWQGREHFFTGPSAGPGTHNDHIHWAMYNWDGKDGNYAFDPATGQGGGGRSSPSLGPVRKFAAQAFRRALGELPSTLGAKMVGRSMAGVPAAIPKYVLGNIFDTGGRWYPNTLGYNAGRGGVETVRTQAQEQALNSRTVRIDHRDLQYLANLVAAVLTGQKVVMDGHAVGETLARQTYVPQGV